MNVSVAMSLAAGMDTGCRFVVDPLVDQNVHELFIEGDFGETYIRVTNMPSPIILQPVTLPLSPSSRCWKKSMTRSSWGPERLAGVAYMALDELLQFLKEDAPAGDVTSDALIPDIGCTAAIRRSRRGSLQVSKRHQHSFPISASRSSPEK